MFIIKLTKAQQIPPNTYTVIIASCYCKHHKTYAWNIFAQVCTLILIVYNVQIACTYTCTCVFDIISVTCNVHVHVPIVPLFPTSLKQPTFLSVHTHVVTCTCVILSLIQVHLHAFLLSIPFASFIYMYMYMYLSHFIIGERVFKRRGGKLVLIYPCYSQRLF